MKLLLGLGNPGPRYRATRHNTGWRVLDRLASQHSASWLEKAKFHAAISEFSQGSEKVVLAKPTTFYNETGRAARALIDFYKLDPARDVLVIHDDLALPFGSIRVRETGSDAGNNGIKSLNAHLGPDYARLRIGIASELRPRLGDVEFVLAAFTPEENDKLEATVVPRALELADDFMRGDLMITSHNNL